MITLDSEARLSSPGRSDAQVVRAHYYDAGLQRAICETGAVDGRGILARAAAISVRRHLAHRQFDGSPDGSILAAVDAAGIGAMLGFDKVPGGYEIALNSHHAKARRTMFGLAAEPSCDFLRGVIAGALEATMGDAYGVEEVECGAAGADVCHFVARPAGAALEVPELLSPRLESFETESDPGLASAEVGVLRGLLEQNGGSVPGASYGSLWSEMYARAAIDFEEELPRAMGAKFSNLAAVVLTEAAHLGAYYALGGLVRSAGWQEHVVGALPAAEDQVREVVALGGSFGWGECEIVTLDPESRITVRVRNGYEALAHGAVAGSAGAPRCYFGRGMAASLMNVFFVADLIPAPELDRSLYNAAFRSPQSFRGIETRCQATGDPFCEFVANPLSPRSRAF